VSRCARTRAKPRFWPASVRIISSHCGTKGDWFEPQAALRKIHRVLRPEGGLALLARGRTCALVELARTRRPVQAAWGEIVCEAKGSVLERETLDERVEIARSRLFGPLEEHEHRWVQQLAIDEFVGLVGSRSYVARFDDPERARILSPVRALAERLGEPIPFRYVACVQVARRLDPGVPVSR